MAHTQHPNMGIGISVDDEGEVVVILTMGDEEPEHFSVLTPEMGLMVSERMQGLAIEGQILQKELDDMSDVQRRGKIDEIKQRYNAEMN